MRSRSALSQTIIYASLLTLLCLVPYGLAQPEIRSNQIVAQAQIGTPTPTPNEGASCNSESCKVKEIIINTGYDQVAGTTYSPVQPDGYWELVNSPNAGLSIPTAAWVIGAISAWQTLPNSQWISAYQQAAWSLNNPAPDKPYSFQRCFCTCKGAKSLKIDMKMLVDNIADVYFDGVLIGSQTNPTVGSFNQPLTIQKIVDVKPGRHCLRVDMRNLSDVAMGVNITGTITEENGAPVMLSAACCNPVGKIMGQKVDDGNCNGKNDTNEVGLAGWTIKVTNTSTGITVTTVTDANGFYYFNNLTPGTYIISETNQIGWTQSLPSAGGTHTVTLAAGQVIKRDFANCKSGGGGKECATIGDGEARCKTDGSGYTYSFTVTNNSGKDTTQILLTPVNSNSTLSQQVYNIPLQNGQSTKITVDIGNIKPETKPCFYVTLMTKDGPCCTVVVCPPLPDCCATATGRFSCGRPGSYSGTFTIVNTSADTIKHIYLYPPAGVTLSQSYFPVTLLPGQPFTTPAINISGAKPGQLCLRISMHTEDMKQCCTAEVCIVLPECEHAQQITTIATPVRTGSSKRRR